MTCVKIKSHNGNINKSLAPLLFTSTACNEELPKGPPSHYKWARVKSDNDKI